MQEPYRKGLASHPGPESCGDAREGVAEALTGEHASGVLSSEITWFLVPTLLPYAIGNIGWGDSASPSRTGGVIAPWRVWKLLAREPGDPLTARPQVGSGRAGKARRSHARDVRSREVGQVHCTAEAAEQRRFDDRGGRGGKGPDRGEFAQQHMPRALNRTRACKMRWREYAAVRSLWNARRRWTQGRSRMR